MEPVWISTGKAAAILGYSRDHFREKFLGVIPSNRIYGGHLRWLESAVVKLAEHQLPKAS